MTVEARRIGALHGRASRARARGWVDAWACVRDATGHRAPVALVVGVIMLVVSAGTGCGHVETRRAPFDGRARAATSAPELFVGLVPTRAHVEVGLVDATGTGSQAEGPAVLVGLRREAAAMGCDAVAKVNVSTGSTAAYAAGVCIVWTDR